MTTHGRVGQTQTTGTQRRTDRYRSRSLCTLHKHTPTHANRTTDSPPPPTYLSGRALVWNSFRFDLFHNALCLGGETRSNLCKQITEQVQLNSQHQKPAKWNFGLLSASHVLYAQLKAQNFTPSILRTQPNALTINSHVVRKRDETDSVLRTCFC